jgi:peptidyl-prolyl cis-trans isomerase D
MLQVFRRHAYSWTTRVLLFLLAAVFAIFFGGLGSYFVRVHPVAKVDCRTVLGVFTLPGCQEILADDVDLAVTNLRRNITNAYGQNAAAILAGRNLRQDAVEDLIERALIEREGAKLGLTISDADLARAIESEPAFQINGRFDQARYVAALRGDDAEPAVFEHDIRIDLMAKTLQQMVTSTVQVSKEESRREFDHLGEKLSLAYIEIPYSNFVAGIQPTDQEIAKFYGDNKEEFREPERVKIDFIRYDPLALAGNSTPSDDQINKYYESNLKAMFTHPEQLHAQHILIAVAPNAPAEKKAAAKTKAEDILKQLEAGADFAKLAQKYSEDPGSRNKGGDLGNVTRGQLVKPFEDAAFKLKPGQMTIAQTQFGYHVIKVDSVTPARVDSLAQVRSKIISDLKRKQGAEVAREDVNQDLSAALVGHSFDDLAKKRGLVAVETPFFAANDSIRGAEDYPQLNQDAFKLEKDEIHVITSGPVPYLVKMLGRKPAHIPPLEEIKDRVRQTMIRMSAESKAHETASSLLELLKGSANFDAVAAQDQLQVHTTGEFPRVTRSIPGIGAFPEVTELAASLVQVPGIINQVLENGGNSYIFEVVSRTPPSEEEWKIAGPSFTQQMLQQKREIAWDNFLDELKNETPIYIDTQQLGGNSGNSPT